MKRWLFSAPVDLAVFGGTAVIALGLVALAPSFASPDVSWIAGVILVDVAHVWSTAFVVYLDPAEWKRRPALYAGVPIAVFVAGIALYSFGEGRSGARSRTSRYSTSFASSTAGS